MPIAKFGEKLVYFAHVPKAGGTGVVAYLTARGAQVAFNDQHYMSVARKRRWSKTSPQHIDVDALGRLVPSDFFDASFAVVRHPVDRLVSAFHFQIEVEQKIWFRRDFSKWLRRLESTMTTRPYIYDNHVRPMSDLVPQDAMIFFLENGLDQVVPWLDTMIGNSLPPRTVGAVNTRKSHHGAKVEPSPADRQRIAEMYRIDFERFGYDLNGAGVPDNGRRPMATESRVSTSRFDAADLDALRRLGPRVARKIRTRSRTWRES